MFYKVPRKKAIRFRYLPHGKAQRVEIAGDFNDWQPVRMRKQQDGAYAIDIQVANGTCQYKFISDGNWVTDPDHSEWAPNPFGSMNSVARTEV
jgi:1,4-alpha-glucan branching enzyme